ncbi:MAG: ADP-ribosylglycohydrolase family protein [Alicyclobacillaceae bacterium]|nr:ADP-ribosylglycohydrolase family protein [Alicyclobacillaceae bacterium]
MERRYSRNADRFAILVEGKHDRAQLRRLVPDDVLILCTNGIPSHEKLMTLRKQVGSRQAVILTDHDPSGKRIRRLLAEVFPDALHVYTKAGYAGVEGTPLEYLEKQLEKSGVLDPEVEDGEPAGRDLCRWKNLSRRERIRGAFLGLAVGDALGAPVRHLTPVQIQARYGLLRHMAVGRDPDRSGGDTTEVTAAAVAVAEGILGVPKDSWNKTETGFVPPGTEGTEAHGVRLMRALPIALRYAPDRAAVLRRVISQSKLAGDEKHTAEACAVYCEIVCDGLEGRDLRDSIEDRVRGTEFQIVLHPVDFLAMETVPDGGAVNSLRWALYGLLASENFEKAVTTAVNWGYDAATTGAVVGGLAGVFYGDGAIPRNWLLNLRGRRVLEQLADRMAKRAAKTRRE